MTPRQWAFAAYHTLRDDEEAREQAWEADKARSMMALLIAVKPEDAAAILQGKAPPSAPPPEEDGPQDARTFALGDLYFHRRPPGLQRPPPQRGHDGHGA